MSATQHITQPAMPTQWPYLWAWGCGESTPHTVRPARAWRAWRVEVMGGDCADAVWVCGRT